MARMKPCQFCQRPSPEDLPTCLHCGAARVPEVLANHPAPKKKSEPEPAWPPAPSEAKEPRPSLPKKILVIDDEPPILEVLKKRLEANQYQVITALDGVEGFEKVKSEIPDLVILDILMPRMTGYDFLRCLKKEGDRYRRIPVVIITAKGSMKEFFEGLEIQAFLVKPFDPETLLGTVKELLVRAENI